MSLALLVASDTGERMEDVLWNMTAPMAIKLAAMIYAANTGKPVMTHREKAIVRRQDEVVRSIQNVK